MLSHQNLGRHAQRRPNRLTTVGACIANRLHRLVLVDPVSHEVSGALSQVGYSLAVGFEANDGV